MSGMQVIHQGTEWPFEGKDPCTKDMLPFLERNESIISWVQPVHSHGVSGQVPVHLQSFPFFPLLFLVHAVCVYDYSPIFFSVYYCRYQLSE